MKRKRNGFTLIELIAVLVIMAIIALIVTPLVMSIIRKARVSADKRSIDAYGRSIELAIAGYLLDTGKFPTEVSQLTIEYSGNEVVCETTQINTDSSVYLAGCTVAGRNVENYTYGSDKSPTYTAYTVGDQVTYNNVNYYVIKDSATTEENVTLLKAEPLSADEVNTYGGVGTANNHVNKYDYNASGEATAAGAMAFYTSETCGYVNGENVTSGCITSYNNSDIKYVVDAWKNDQAPKATEARLINTDEIETEKQEHDCCGGCGQCITTIDVIKYDWMYNVSDLSNGYWTGTPDTSSGTISVSIVTSDGKIGSRPVDMSEFVVRPVIVLPKSEL